MVLSLKDSFKVSFFNPVIDYSVQSFEGRSSAYEAVLQKFWFLSRLDYLTSTEIAAAARELMKAYPYDLEDKFATELAQFAHLFSESEQRLKQLCL